MTKKITIEHPLCDLTITLKQDTDTGQLESVLMRALEHYQANERLPIDMIRSNAQARHGDYYQTPGYYLRLYRQRAELTQAKLASALSLKARQVSAMENNKRPISAELATQLADILKCSAAKLQGPT